MTEDQIKEFYLNLYSSLLNIYGFEEATERLIAVKGFLMGYDEAKNKK